MLCNLTLSRRRTDNLFHSQASKQTAFLIGVNQAPSSFRENDNSCYDNEGDVMEKNMARSRLFLCLFISENVSFSPSIFLTKLG